MILFDHHTQFVTVTCLNWLPVLKKDLHKDILLESFRKRVREEAVSIYAFVIMPNHFHAIWQLHDGIKKHEFQRDLLKFTSRSILGFMKMHDDPLLAQLEVKDRDRRYQVWERNALSMDMYSEAFFQQKFDYLHNNPVHPKWKLTTLPEDYKYSSASFYMTGQDDFGFLQHYDG
ncbi:MAG: transposase [Chitinophagaceae bacterium]|jgi:REP element-mobilizing transposase RayT|nr:transposase [Chitinophagaceae bacterium]